MRSRVLLLAASAAAMSHSLKDAKCTPKATCPVKGPETTRVETEGSVAGKVRGRS